MLQNKKQNKDMTPLYQCLGGTSAEKLAKYGRSRKDGMSLGFLCTKQHQVFGGFYGTAVLDDGKEITLNGQRGFAEKVYNKW